MMLLHGPLIALLSLPFVVLAYPGHGRSLQARAISPDNTCGGTNGYTCPGSLPCCSKYNWCGSTDAYCGAGCQAAFGTCSVVSSSSKSSTSSTKPSSTKTSSPSSSTPSASPTSSGNVSPDNSCGGTKGYVCPGSLPCCSKYNWCGITDAYCGAGCQSGFGTCSVVSSSSKSSTSSTKPSSTTPSSTKPSSTTPSSTKPSSTKTSSPSSASPSASATSSGNVSPDNTCGGTNGYVCPGSLPCCSKYNWCGSTPEYCGTGCQIAFGVCSVPGTTSQPPIPTSTGGTASIPRPKIGSVPYGNVITACVRPGDIAITFDDGPYIYTPDLLDLLARYNVKATFFMVANNGNGAIDQTAAWISVIQRMYNEGHQVASHTWDHPDLTTLSSAQRKDQMYRFEAALANILGFFPTYMRPPYLAFNAACQTDMADLGYHVISTNLDTKDYANDSPTLIQDSKDKFNTGVSNNSPSTSSFIVLNHDNHYQTVYTLAEYEIQRSLATGYRPVTVGECLGDPAANWYRSVPGATRRAVAAPAGKVTTEELTKLGIKPPVATCVYVDAPKSIVRLMRRARLQREGMSEAVY